MRKLVTATAIAALCASAPAFSQATARSGTNSPTATHDNPSSCLGAERATRNSNGGDRAQGGFGQAQSNYVQSLVDQGMTYGEALQTFKDACEYAPGTTGSGSDDDSTD
jgi:hypothetical protein